MKEFFNPENKMWNSIGKLADTTVLSFLWVLTSLPIITMGASTAAFFDFTFKMVRDHEGMVFSAYFKAFKKHFFKGTIINLAGLAFYIFLFWDFRLALAYYKMSGGGFLWLTLALSLFTIACVFTLYLFYVYGLLAVFDKDLKKLAKDGLAMTFANPGYSLLIFLACLACFALIYYLSGLFFLWLGLLFLLVSYILTPLFRDMSKKSEREGHV